MHRHLERLLHSQVTATSPPLIEVTKARGLAAPGPSQCKVIRGIRVTR